MLFRALLSLILTVGSVLAQSSSSYTDSDNGIVFQGYTDPVYSITYGAVFPPLSESSTEFIGEIIAPVETKWVGLSLGGAMLKSLLLVAWPYEGAIVSSTRYAQTYVLPTKYDGPTLTNLPSTSVNSTHWKWVFRCQNCTSWDGGSIDLSGEPVFAWAHGATAVNTPSDPQSTFIEHDDFGFFGENVAEAHSDDYASYIGA